MKKLFLLILTIFLLLFSSCKTDEEIDKDFLTLLCSGVEFSEKESFEKIKDSWVEPENYTFTYEYQKSIPFAEFEIVECIIEDGKFKSYKFIIPEFDPDVFTEESYEALKENYKHKKREKNFESIKDIFDFCQEEYEYALKYRYVFKTRISMTLDDTDSYPTYFKSHIDDVYTNLRQDHSELILGDSLSGVSTTVKILDFKIN